MPMTYFSDIPVSSIQAASAITLDNEFGTIVKLIMGDSPAPHTNR